MPATPATAQFEHSVLPWNGLKTTSIAGVRVLFGVHSQLNLRTHTSTVCNIINKEYIVVHIQDQCGE